MPRKSARVKHIQAVLPELDKLGVKPKIRYAEAKPKCTCKCYPCLTGAHCGLGFPENGVETICEYDLEDME